MTLLGYTFPPLAALATAPLLAAGLGVEGRGELASATAPLLLAASLATIGVPPAVTFVVARAPRLAVEAARRGALLVSGAGLIAVALTLLARDWLSAGDPGVGRLMVIAALAVVPTVIITVLQAGAAGLGQWGLVTAERLITSVAKIASIGSLFLTDQLTGLTAVVAIAFSPILGGFVYVLLRAGRSSGVDEGLVSARYGTLLHYGMRVWIGSVAGILLMRVDQIIFLPVGGAYELGLYVVAATISEVPLILNNAIRDVLFTHDASRGQDSTLTFASRASTFVTAGAAAVIAVTAWLWVPWLFGADFAAATPALLILLLAVVAGNPGSIAGTGLAARGRPGLRSLSLLAACLLNVGLFVLLVPGLGAVGAAIATLVGNVVASNLNIWFLRRHFGIPVGAFYAIGKSDIRAVFALLRRKDGAG